MASEPDAETTAAGLRRQLAAGLEKDGWLRSPEWRAALEAVPRHAFIPRFYRERGGPGVTTWEPVTEVSLGQEAWWLRLVYSAASG
ncbi:hypothetical protein [Streptomyces chartreusis]